MEAENADTATRVEHARGPKVRLETLVRRLWLFVRIVWRPVTGDPGASWWQDWVRYRLDARTAWDVCKVIHD